MSEQICRMTGRIGLLAAAALVVGGAQAASGQYLENFNGIESGTSLNDVPGWDPSDSGSWVVTEDAGYTGNGAVAASAHVYKNYLSGSEVLTGVPNDVFEIKIMPASVATNQHARPWIYLADNSPDDPTTDGQTNGVGVVFIAGEELAPDPETPIGTSTINFLIGGTSWWNASTPPESRILDSEGAPVRWKKQTWYTVQFHGVLSGSPTVSIFETDTQEFLASNVPATGFGAGPVTQIDHIGLRESSGSPRDAYYDDIKLMERLGGDASVDGQVTIADLGILAANWQQTDRHWIHGDFNEDGDVTIADLGILAANWQQSVFGGGGDGMSFEEAMAMFDVFDGVVVPEPASLGLLATAGLLARRRRRA